MVPARPKVLRKNSNSDDRFDRFFTLYRSEGHTTTKPKKGTTMNPVTHFKKLSVLPPLIVLTFVLAVSARATPQCGFSSVNLLFPGTKMGEYFPSGWLNLHCRAHTPAR